MILVTGGTGLVGSHLLVALAEQGQTVRAIRRKNSQLEAVKTVFNYHESGEQLFNSIEWVEADLLDVIALNKALVGISKVYHCAAYISFDPAKTGLLRKVNIEGTANLVNAALASGAKQLCYISSIATLGQTPDSSPIKETTAWNPQHKNSGYAISKYGAELEVWRGAQEGLPAVILHPGVILGEGHWDRASGAIIPKLVKGPKFYPKGTIALVDVKDLIQAIVAVSNSKKALGNNYIVVGENLSYKDFFNTLLTAAKSRKSIKPISKFTLNIFAFLNYLSSKIFGSKRVLSPVLVASMYNKSMYSNAKIKSEFGIEFTPIIQTIKRQVERLNATNL